MLFVVGYVVLFFFFKQKTAYEMRISDWSSDVCSSDLFSSRALRIVFSSQPTEPATRVGPCSAQRSTSGLLKSSRASYSVSGTIGGRTLLRLVMQKAFHEQGVEHWNLECGPWGTRSGTGVGRSRWEGGRVGKGRRRT